MSQFIVLAIAAIFSSNIVSVCGVGAITLQSEKKNFGYMLASTFCFILSIIVTGLLYCVIEKYVLIPLKADYLKLLVVVLISVTLAFISRAVLKPISKEVYFLYEKSYSLPVQSAVTIGTMFIVDFSADIFNVMFSLAMFCVGFLIVQIIFYALYEKLDNTYNLKPARNVPIMLFTLAIVSMILYTVGLFF